MQRAIVPPRKAGRWTSWRSPIRTRSLFLKKPKSRARGPLNRGCRGSKWRRGGLLFFLDEKDLWPVVDYVTTHLIVNRAYLKSHPDEIKKLLRAHIESTLWIST